MIAAPVTENIFSTQPQPLLKLLQLQGACSLAEDHTIGGERGWPTFVTDQGQNIKPAQIGIPRWRLEGGSRKRASYSEILERCWRHTLQA
jgi:hypothetical protein